MTLRASPIDTLAQEASALREQNRFLEQRLKFAEAWNEKLRYAIDDLLRRLFGPKSDKIDPAQMELLCRELRNDDALADATQDLPLAEDTPKPVKRRGGGRRPAPSRLPIEVISIDPPVETLVGMKRIREEITQETDYKPSQFIRRHYVCGVWVREDGTGTPLIAPLPVRVIPQSEAGAGVLAHTLVAKHVDHCPLTRQEKIAARDGVDLWRQKLGRWVEESALLLRTVHEQLAQRIRDSGYIQADETAVKVLDPDRGGKAREARLWTFHAPNDDCIVFDFNLSRGRESPERFIPEGWSGSLQSDGYAVYASLARDRPGIRSFGCMAHCRRYIADAIKAGDAQAVPFLTAIAQLYAIEAEAGNRKLSHVQRGQLRHAKARPILKELQRAFKKIQPELRPTSALGDATRYALNQWPTLGRYAKVGNGHVRIDNNPVERGIRPTKLGMKNWLFIGHPDAGWRSAVIYSMGTCKLLNVNPEAYLHWVLPRLAAATTKTASGLLPHDFLALKY